MVVTLNAQHFELTPAIRQFALANLQEPIESFWDKQGAQLEIHLRDLRGTKGGIDKECRCILYVPGGRKVVITEVTEDMRKSIHQARKRLVYRMRQYVGQRIQGPRHPTKYYLADMADKELVGPLARSEDVHGASERSG